MEAGTACLGIALDWCRVTTLVGRTHMKLEFHTFDCYSKKPNDFNASFDFL